MARTVTAFLCTFIVVILLARVTLGSLQDDIATRMNDTGPTLSRKRRYLVFPEGSSLQLVYCLTMPSLGMGQIFTIGSTVALAWELPHDPFEPFRRPSEVLHRIDKQPGKYTSGGWTLENSPAPVSYMKTNRYNPFLVNKPSLGYTTINAQKPSGLYQGFTWADANTRRINNNRLALAENPNNYRNVDYSKRPFTSFNSRGGYNEPVDAYLHPVYHKVYRRTRRDLYSKIEKLFTGLSRDGKACLLKSVCEVSKAAQKRGTFMEEIIKVIFRVRHHQDDGDEENDEYDLAANKQHNCTEMYPSCEHSVWQGMFSFK